MIERTRTLTIASNLKELHKVEAFIEEISEDFNINHTYFGHLLVSLTEAVKNAIIHGNRGDEDKKVQIRFQARESSLQFSVKDAGDGFDYENLPDPTESKEQSIGTGIFLIKQLSDKIEWIPPGNQLRFAFTIASINFAKSSERIRVLKDYYQGYGKKKEAEEEERRMKG
jgi:serine/threonine-protein kinase RsbW